MGVLSMYFKSNFLGLLKSLNNLNWFIVFFSLINLSVCIYEDQIGKFDWRQTYVGRIKFAQFDTVSTAKKLIVATEENVLAALHLKTGQVVWRHVFESTSAGNIQLLDVTETVVTVSGANPYLVRGWESATGVLLWEWSLTLRDAVAADDSLFWVQQGMLVHMVPVVGSHIEVTMYNLWSGANKGATSKLPAQWVNDGCVLSPPYYTCISDTQILISLDVTSNAVTVISKPLADLITPTSDTDLRPLDGNSVIPGFVLDDKKIVVIKDDKFEVIGVGVKDESASVTVIDGVGAQIVLQAWNDGTKTVQTAHNAWTGQEVSELRASIQEPHIPEPVVAAGVCSKSREAVCRVLLTAADDAAHLLDQAGRIMWSREEALANVVAAEFVELPVSDLDAAIEAEFDHKEAAKMYSSIWTAFSRRLQTQLQQLQTLIHNLQRGEMSLDTEGTRLVRDYFNLHKIIVLVTDVGKIFGMDNLSGEILWRVSEPNLDTESVGVFTRRSPRHPPHHAVLTVVAKHQVTGNAVIMNMNPITGSLLEATRHLSVRPRQCALLHRADHNKLHALILLDHNENVSIFPESAAPLVENMFMYVADKNTAVVQGYALKYNGQKVVAIRTWSVRAGGDSSATLAAVVGKPAWERVRSAGTVLGDRSVLYKHSNHNLLLLLASLTDHATETLVSMCVDAVSGAVVCAAAARRARPLPFAVHTDNAMAYAYYTDKTRRVEISTVELYEGKERWLPAGAAFSSLATSLAPGVERQAYILGGVPTAAANTHTEKSLTDKHVLVALSSGAIVQLPWQLLEARRPLSPSAADREEGLVPYAPELPLAADQVINYNMTLHRLKHIYTAPSGLESTSLVLATGLDLFYTRVAPSKTFDLLKDDFDYYLITIVLAALVVATYSTKYFASRKMLKMAWK